MQTNCALYVKVVTNKRLNMLRVLATFDNTKRNTEGQVIVTQRNCIFASGDLCNVNASAEAQAYEIQRSINYAKAQFNTSNIILI